MIVLDGDERLEGQILQEKRGEVVIKVPFGTLTIERSRIVRIERKGMQGALLERAEVACRSGDFALAIRYLEEGNPGDGAAEDPAGLASAFASLGEAAGRAERYGVAARALRAAARLAPSEAGWAARAAEMERRAAALAEEEAKALAGAASGGALEAIPVLEGVAVRAPERRPGIRRRLAGFLRQEASTAVEKGEVERAFRAGLEALKREPETAPLEGPGWPRLVSWIADAWPPGGEAALLHAVAYELHGIAGQEPLGRYLDGRAYEAEKNRERARASYLLSAPTLPSSLSLEAARLGAERELGIQEGPKPPSVAALRAVPTYETENFQIAYTARSVGDAARTYAEGILQAVAQRVAPGERVLPFPPDRKCILRIYDAKADYLERSDQPPWSDGVSLVRTRDGELVGHFIQTWAGAPELMESTLPHEMGHVVLAAAVGYVPDLPLWLQEGIACQQESEGHRRRYLGIARSALGRGREIPLEAILVLSGYPASGDGQDLFYSESLTLVDYLTEQYGAGRLLAWARTLKDIPPAGRAASLVRHYAFPDLASLEHSWKASIR